MRDALFNIVAGWVQRTGSRVLDLFAGTGALGLEALRRGAAAVVFVEHDHALAEAIRRRGQQGGWSEQIEVWRRDAVAAVRDLGRAGRQFDLIVLDPPYGRRWIPKTLQATVAAGVLAPGGILVAEGHWRDRPEAEGPERAKRAEWVAGLTLIREARYGETVLWFFEQAKEGS